MKTFRFLFLCLIHLPYLAICQTDDSLSFVKLWNSELSKSPIFHNSILYSKSQPICIKGDFFNDSIEDYVFFVEDKTYKHVKLVFINITPEQKQEVHFLGYEDDPFNISDYRWAQVFKKVNEGNVLWSNYTDDFRDLNDVPENEKVYLDYDAIYLHALESCGGGFIYWKKGKFHWLQQE